MARILLLGGLDPSGGAGITLDAAVVSVLGGVPLPIAVVLTAQGLRGFVAAAPVAATFVSEQVAAVQADGPIDCVKIGYLGSATVAAFVAELLTTLPGSAKVVVDPVLGATAGGMASNADLIAAYRELLLPRATLVTPNTPELELLGGGDAQALLALGVGAVLHKGGHGEGASSIDALWSADRGDAPMRFERPRHDCGPVRGTGCALASAIACQLAVDDSLPAACRQAGDWLGAKLARITPAADGLARHLPIV